MAEYTEREALIEAFRAYMAEHCDKEKCVSAENCETCELKCLWHRVVMKVPAADVVEVVHARWEKRGNHDWGCSACKIGVPYDRTGDHYCYNCGARMDG